MDNQMTRRRERSAGPTIKEVLEALSEEEDRAAAGARTAPPQRPGAHPRTAHAAAPPPHQVMDRAATSDVIALHPGAWNRVVV